MRMLWLGMRVLPHALDQMPGVTTRPLEGEASLRRQLQISDDVVAVVIGPLADDPISLVEQVSALRSGMPTLLLSGKEAVEDLEQRVRFSPYSSRSIAVVSSDEPNTAREILEGLMREWQQRRDHEKVVQRMQEALPPLATPNRSYGIHSDTLLKLAPISVLRVSRAGRVLDTNAHADKLLESTSMIGLSLLTLFANDEADRVRLILEQAATRDDGDPATGIATRVSLSGREQVLRLTAAAIPDSPKPSVEGRHVLTVLEDITQDIREQQRKDDYLAFASHELRSPLTPVAGMARYLFRHIENPGNLRPDDFREAVETLYGETQRMIQVVDIFLDLSRLEADRFELHFEEADLVALARDEIERTRARYTSLPIELRAPERLVGQTDTARLQLIIANLLDNAAKYGPTEGPVTMTIVEEKQHVVLRVHDRGGGIPEDEQAHIFQRFYRASSSSNKKGSGVGLFLCREIARRLGGELNFRSTPEEGTEFWLTLPPGDLRR